MERSAGAPRPTGIGPLLIVAVVVALALAGAFDGLWVCPLKRVAGVPCPGCGMTRAARLLLAGDVAGATAHHPLVVVAVPAAIGFAVLEVRGWVRERRWGVAFRPLWARALAFAGLGLLVLVWILRFFGFFGGPAD